MKPDLRKFLTGRRLLVAGVAAAAVAAGTAGTALAADGAEPAWEVEITGQDGARHELLVDGAGGTVTRNETEHGGHGKKKDDGKKEDDGRHEGKRAGGKHEDGKHDDHGGQDDD